MSDWHIGPGVDPAAAARFADLGSVFALEGEIVALDSMTRTLRVEVNGRRYYVKRYTGLGKKPLRRWLATPRVQLEWENLRHFAAWGIPTARLVAYGLERQGGRFVRGALITAEIPGTADLNRIARDNDPRLESQTWWDGVASQIAAITRRLHAQRFVHGDLKWRNLLVDAAGKVFLIDCPSGAFWWPPFLKYRIIKDLACLDKVARLHISRTRRLRFYLDYMQKRRLDAADKETLRRIVHFFDGRELMQETAASLRAMGRRLPAHCTVALDGGRELAITDWLRVLPGKRLTGIGRWQGRTVLAKLFIAARGSERHWQREGQGGATLAAHGLPTPALLASGRFGEGGHYLLSEFLADARIPSATTATELTPVFEQVGRMHAGGILQEDAHLGNFLCQGDRLFVIDGDAIRPVRSSQDCADNLALLLAQLLPETETALRDGLLVAYRRGHPAAVLDPASLAAASRTARTARLADYLDKCLRDCSLFKVVRRIDRFFAIVRAETGLLAPLIHDPDAWLEKGIPLKRGRTATLALIEVNGRKLVIKRYNIKSAGHALSRCWRPSRAWHAWRESHRLQFLGIATPRPLALVEHRFGPLRGRAWLISEYCPGENLATRLAGAIDAPPAADVAVAGKLFAQLAEAHISHGDLKATNLLWHEGRINLVDLDATRQHEDAASFKRAWRRDRARFLRNWPEASALHAALAAALPDA